MIAYLLIAFSLVSCATTQVIHLKNISDDEAVTKEALFELKPNWKMAYENYVPKEDATLDTNFSILIVGATWCHDSDRELPRLLKVLNHFSVSDEQIKIYLTDRKKTEPANIIAEYRIFFTPTIIILYQGKEVKRFVENPQTNWAKDLKTLATEVRE